MSANVYAWHRKHTARTGAYAILQDGTHVASITIAYPKEGASRLYAYVHWIGTRMVRGSATGYGYDKRSAAMASAARAMTPAAEYADIPDAFRLALVAGNAHGWAHMLREAGFTVLCVAE
jgi:hypothetical protein